MNSTSSVIIVNHLPTASVKSSFIPLDILTIVCLTLTLLLALIFLFIMILDKKYHTVPMILIANICLTELVCGSNTLAMTVVTLQNDLQQIQYQDSLCIFRGYFSYASCALHNYSYLLSAIYRYMIIVYPTRLIWRTAQMQILLIALSWIIAFGFPVPFLFTGVITYDVDDQICQIPFRFSFSIIYAPLCVFIIPVNLVIFIYMRLVGYVKEVSKRVTPRNTLIRLRRELKMVRRTFILIMILFISGVPYSSFIFLSFANLAPQYHFRIAYIFVNGSLLFVMIALFKFTESFTTSMKKIIYGRQNMVIPAMG